MVDRECKPVRLIVTLSYTLPRAVEAKLIRDAEARSVACRQRHGEGMFSPDGDSKSDREYRLRH